MLAIAWTKHVYLAVRTVAAVGGKFCFNCTLSLLSLENLVPGIEAEEGSLEARTQLRTWVEIHNNKYPTIRSNKQTNKQKVLFSPQVKGNL